MRSSGITASGLSLGYGLSNSCVYGTGCPPSVQAGTEQSGYPQRATLLGTDATTAVTRLRVMNSEQLRRLAPARNANDDNASGIDFRLGA